MIRKSTINLNYGNTAKENNLIEFIVEYTQIVNFYIDMLWEKQIFSGRFLSKEGLTADSWLSERAKQCAGKQALQIVKSQRKKNQKTKPVFSGSSIELDSRFTDIEKGKNSFDIWIKFTSLGKKIKILIPSKKHLHFNKFTSWNKKKSARLRVRRDGQIYLDVFFEKKEKDKKHEGKIVGLDCGYKKLAVLSNGVKIGTDLEDKVEKISRKKQKSKTFNRALKERNEYIDREIKSLDLKDVKGIVVEDLKSVKHGTKGKIRKKFNNKLQRWVYRYFLNRLEQHCEVVGVQLHKVDPAYTSQECSACGYIHRSNRNGEIFRCRSCGYTADADFNASLNILNRWLQKHMVSVQQSSFYSFL